MARFIQKRDEVTVIEDRHQSAFELMEQFNCSFDYELPEKFKTLVLTMEQFFGNEQQLMEKSFFPAVKCHLEQHAKVLAALHHIHIRVMQGDNELARRVGGRLLSDWFRLHTATLDQAAFVWFTLNKHSILIQPLHCQIHKKQKALRISHVTQKSSKPHSAGYFSASE